MLKKINLFVAIGLMMALPQVGYGTGAAGLQNCAAISADDERLSCFDRLAAATKETAPANPPSTEGVERRSSRPPINDDVGIERRKEKEEAAEESYAVVIVSCDKNASTRRVSFTLDNGQVWRQKNAKWLSLKACRSEGVISKGYFGFKLFVDSLKQSYGVVRVQ